MEPKKVHMSAFFVLKYLSLLTVTIRAGHFWPKRSKIDFWGTKRTWIMKIPLRVPPKIKFRIF